MMSFGEYLLVVETQSRNIGSLWQTTDTSSRNPEASGAKASLSGI